MALADGGVSCSDQNSGRAWRELEFWFLVLLWAGIYVARLTTPAIRGEESRWAQVAVEMQWTGDYVVPRQQGLPFSDRPPLNSWGMLLASAMFGQWNLAIVRLPSVLAVLGTTLVVYGYSRQLLTRTGAFAASAAHLTMAQVLKLGRLAESDALLTFWVTASLLLWHSGYMKQWPRSLTWAIGYGLAATAALTKGPQGPIYFAGAIGIYLVVRRDWRYLLSGAHVLGWLAFAVVLGSWQIPFLMRVGWAEVLAVWSEGDSLGARFEYPDVIAVVAHFFGYPLAVCGAMLPWSILLWEYASPRARQNLAPVRPYFTFLLIACGLAFITCWLPVHTRARYFMPLYPSVAIFVGWACQQCWQGSGSGWWLASWRRIQVSSVVAMLGAVAILGAAGVFGASHWRLGLLWPGAGPALAMILALLGLASIAWWARRGSNLIQQRAGVVALGGFLGLVYTGMVVQVMARVDNCTPERVAEVKQLLGPDTPLVSFGRVHHVFAYYFGEPIECRPLPSTGEEPPEQVDYFCFDHQTGSAYPSLPFAWEPVDVVPCDRLQLETPVETVVVGRRITGQAKRPSLER